MKSLLSILLIVMLMSCNADAQKVYKRVDSLIQYKNGEIIVYKDKYGKPKSDTIYFNKMKASINIGYVEVVIIDDKKILKPKQ